MGDTANTIPRCGDHVYHAPTGETWVVAWADASTNDLAWCGWPNGIARLSDCEIVKRVSDTMHAKCLALVIKGSDSRASRAKALYGDPHP